MPCLGLINFPFFIFKQFKPSLLSFCSQPFYNFLTLPPTLIPVPSLIPVLSKQIISGLLTLPAQTGQMLFYPSLVVLLNYFNLRVFSHRREVRYLPLKEKKNILVLVETGNSFFLLKVSMLFSARKKCCSLAK